MEAKKVLVAASAVWSVVFAVNCYADNPIIQNFYSADPAPFVKDGVCYLYTSHDEDVTERNFFTMKNWLLYTSTDMANWTDHGIVATLYDFEWAKNGWGGGYENGGWAPQAIERNGKWYLYCPLQGRGIGVLVADNPAGPFHDPIGKPLVGGDHIDPSVFIDDDGQAYLYWGNPKCWYAKLNKDMISIDTTIGDKGLVALDMSIEEFGKRTAEDEKRATTYEEGPWLYKRNNLYYLFFAGGPISEHLGYSTSKSPIGPWKYGNVIMKPQSAFTIHPGVVDFKGKTYLFYHNAGLPGGGGFKRSVCVDELVFNADGSVKEVVPTKEGPKQVGTLNPYETVQAETMFNNGGVETEICYDENGGMNVCDIDNGDFIQLKGVDFGSGASSFEARVASYKSGGKIELRLGSKDGKLVGTCLVPHTQGWQKWKTVSCTVEGATGVNDLFLVFVGDNGIDLMTMNWWKFKK